ncbi:MAG: TolC family protein [Nitrospinaceae bacterium]
MKFSRLCIVLTIPFLVTACATVNPQKDFDAVALSSKKKTGYPVTWQQTPKEEEQTKLAVKELLNNGISQDEAIRIALINNQDLQAKFEFLGIARADIIQAGLYSNPSVGALFEFPVKGSFGVGPDLDLLFSLSDLWNVPLRRKIAMFDGQKVTLQVIQEILNTAAAARNAFNEVLFQKELIVFTRKNIQLLQKTLEKTKVYYESGFFRDMDLYLAESFLYEEKLALAKAEADLNNARAELMRQLGLDPLAPDITPRGELEETQPVDLTPAKAWNFAYDNRLDLKISRFQIEQSKWVLKLQKARIYGDVNLGGNYTRELDNLKTFGPLLSFQIPVFDQNQGGIARAQYQLHQAEKILAANETAAKEEIRRLISELKVQHHKATLLRDKILILDKKSEEYAEKYFNAMQLNAFFLIEARRRVFNTYRGYLQARRDYRRIKSKLKLALGGTLPD